MPYPRMLNDALAGRRVPRWAGPGIRTDRADEPFPIPQWTEPPSGNRRDVVPGIPAKASTGSQLADAWIDLTTGGRTGPAQWQEFQRIERERNDLRPEDIEDMTLGKQFKNAARGADAGRGARFRTMKTSSLSPRLPSIRGLGAQSMLIEAGADLLSRQGAGAVPRVSDAQKLRELRTGERFSAYDPIEWVHRTSRAFGDWYGAPRSRTPGGVHLPGAHLRAYSRSTTAADRRRESEGRYFNRKKGQWEHAAPQDVTLADKERQRQHERNMRYLAVGNEPGQLDYPPTEAEQLQAQEDARLARLESERAERNRIEQQSKRNQEELDKFYAERRINRMQKPHERNLRYLAHGN